MSTPQQQVEYQQTIRALSERIVLAQNADPRSRCDQVG